MNRLLASITLSVILVVSLFTPLPVYADTYGSGLYGAGAYGAQGSSNSNSAITSIGNSLSAFFCSNQAPSSAPNLYEIDATSTTATLYFAPAGGPDDNYYIAYGQGNNSEGNGIQLSTSPSSGALFYKIELLSPSTVYTFKVRGGNGCKPGPWSNTLTIQTLSSRSRATKKFYPNNQAQYVQAKPASWLAQAQAFVSDVWPGAPNTGLAPAKQHVLGASTKKSETTHSSNTSLWGTISHFFSGIFRGF